MSVATERLRRRGIDRAEEPPDGFEFAVTVTR